MLPRLVEHEISLKNLDARHGDLRIVHLTDLHCGYMTPSRHLRHAIELVHDAEPDLVVMTGDYVSFHRNEIRMMEALLGELRAPHVVATLGNHDYYASGSGVAEALRRCGHTVLHNEHRVLELRGAPLTIVGVDDPVTRKADLDSAFKDLPAQGTRLVLCHCPETVKQIAHRGADLVLSGHTHGGQINVKGVTDKIFQRAGREYFRSGLYQVRDTQLYVSPGVGFSGVPVRVGHGTRAEVTLFRLKSMS